jgi:glycosyltransferase involved in cell wall biosynthesis
MMSWVLREARAVTAVSTYLAAEAAAALNVGRDQIPVIPMPLALGTVADPDAARAGAIFVGRLTKDKGIPHLLDALAILRRQGRPMDLTIVGDGPERAALKALGMALGLNVTFTGHVAPDQVGRHLRDKQVFVFPALHDDLGIVVAEALTQGVPVVATRSGGVPDLLVDREAGILIPPTDHREIARAIIEVCTNDRFKVGALRAGRILADRMSPEKVAEQFEVVYGRMRGVRPSGAGAKEQRPSGAASRESPRP